MKNLVRDFRAAFGSVWQALGVVLSAIAVFNFGVRFFEIGLGPILAAAVVAFRSVTHPIIDALVGWLPFRVSPTAKDALTLWLVFSGAMMRTIFTRYRVFHQRKIGIAETLRVAVEVVFAWPFMLLPQLRRPLLVLHDGGPAACADMNTVRRYAQNMPNYRIVMDSRAVFTFQFIVIAAVLICLTVASLIGL